MTKVFFVLETLINIVCGPYIPDFTVYMIYIDNVGDEVMEIFQIEVILLNMVLLVAILWQLGAI